MLGFGWSDGEPGCELDFPDFEFWHADREASKAKGRRVLAELRSRADERGWSVFGHPDPHEVGAGRHPGGQWTIHGRNEPDFGLAIGDGALGFWKALAKVYGNTRQQRCWVHKTGNVLNGLPKVAQPRAKQALHQIWMAETRQDAYRAFDEFITTYSLKFPKATACLAKDREELLAFYDFPAEHWPHLRTTNPIESTFATVKLRDLTP